MTNYDILKEYEKHGTPLPSYDAYMVLIRAYDSVTEQNAQLKELLKECKEKILLMDYDSIKIEILQKIDEVLK